VAGRWGSAENTVTSSVPPQDGSSAPEAAHSSLLNACFIASPDSKTSSASMEYAGSPTNWRVTRCTRFSSGPGVFSTSGTWLPEQCRSKSAGSSGVR
jgi:hypothetical protein